MKKDYPFVSEIGQHVYREISLDSLDDIFEAPEDSSFKSGYDMVFLHAAVSEMITSKKFSQNQAKVIVLLLGYSNYPFCPEHFVGMRTQRKVAQILGKSYENLNLTIKRIKKKIYAFLKDIDVNDDIDIHKEFPSYYACQYNVNGYCWLYCKKCLKM